MIEPTPFDPPTTVIRAAHRRARALRLLVIHALAFAIVNASLATVDLLDGGGFTTHRNLAGWAIGLTVHAAVVLIKSQPLDRWEQRQADRIIASETTARRDPPWVVEPIDTVHDTDHPQPRSRP